MKDIRILFTCFSSCRYQSCFCEENVYQLCSILREEDLEGVFAVFISSSEQQFPLWCQKAQPREGQPVIWDYHVILVDQTARRVFDLDTTLPCGVSTSMYCQHAIRYDVSLPTKFCPIFRIVPAAVFLQHFSSDRSHMMESGKQFPPWEALRGSKAESAHELPRYIDMNSKSAHEGLGQILDKDAFYRWCGADCCNEV